MSQAQIASIYFDELEVTRPLYGGYFKLAAVPKGAAPLILTVNDHIQVETQPFFKGSYNGRPMQQRITVFGDTEIAPDLLRAWTEGRPGMTPDCGPGVWIVREGIPLFDESGKPTVDAEGRQVTRPALESERTAMFAEDLERAQSRQAAWKEYLIGKADVDAEDPKRVPFIDRLARIACVHDGRERTWLHGLKDGDVRKCPYCTKSISINAIKCPFCSEVVDAKRHAAMKAQEKFAYDAEMAALREANKAAQEADRAAKAAQGQPARA